MNGRSQQKHRVVNGRLRNRVERVKVQDEQVLMTIENTEKDYYYAGFWMRLWAFLVDLLTVFALNGLVVYPLVRMTAIGEWQTVATYSTQALLTSLVFFLYFAMMTKKYGQTIGKMIFDLRVVSTNTDELTWTQVIFREGVGRFIHQVFFFLQVLYVTVAFTARKQGMHDMIANTYVIHNRE